MRRGSLEFNNASRIIGKDSMIIRVTSVNQKLEEPMMRNQILQELGIKYDQTNQKDAKQLITLLNRYLTYPLSSLAYFHLESNRLGKLDLKQHVQDKIETIRDYEEICYCCGFIRQHETLPICTDLQKVSAIGVSTYLFFLTFKHIILLMSIMFFVFSIYAIVSNILASEYYKNSITGTVDYKRLSYQSFLAISLGSKQLHSTEGDRISYNIQSWLGVAMVFIWGLVFGYIKYIQRVKSARIIKFSRKASNYTVVIKNFPKYMTKQQLQKQLINFYQTRKKGDSLTQECGQIQVIKINKAVPFYLKKQKFRNQQINRINILYRYYKKLFRKWINQRRQKYQFSVSTQHREQIKQQFLKLQQQRKNQYFKVASVLKKQVVSKNYVSLQTVPTFVTFNSSLTRQSLVAIYDQENFFFHLCFSEKDLQQKFFYIKVPGTDIKIKAQIVRAAEPEDIYWNNLGRSQWEIYRKKAMIFSITLLVLGGSFGAVYGLSKVQFDYTIQDKANQIQYISIMISLVIGIVNVLIQQLLRYLTKLQKNVTRSHLQISFSVKATIALLINNIVIPILVAYFFKQNLYGINGLAYDIFYLAIINSMLSPILRIFDLEYFTFRIIKMIKNLPRWKLHLNQQLLNAATEHIQFQIGYEYIYVNNLFLFTCFFSPIQPIIVVFAIVGLSIMYWAEKNALFNRCRRPVPGNNVVNRAMYQLIYLGPLFYSIGSFCWSHFFKNQFIGIAPNLVASILSVIILLIPYDKIVKNYLVKKQKNQTFYSDNFLFFDSQYQRLNPSTSIDAINQYKSILRRKQKQISEKTPEQQKKIEQNMIKLEKKVSRDLDQLEKVTYQDEDEQIHFAVKRSYINSREPMSSVRSNYEHQHNPKNDNITINVNGGTNNFLIKNQIEDKNIPVIYDREQPVITPWKTQIHQIGQHNETLSARNNGDSRPLKTNGYRYYASKINDESLRASPISNNNSPSNIPYSMYLSPPPNPMYPTSNRTRQYI